MIRSLMVGRAIAALLIVGVGCGDEAPYERSLDPSAAQTLRLGQAASAATGEERFGLIVKLPVSWPQNTGLESGSGTLEHRVLIVRQQSGAEALTLCATHTPGYKTRSFFGGEKYTFDFDATQMADEATSALRLERNEGGMPERLAISLGAQLGDAFSDTWPSASKLSDIAARPVDGPGMSLIPTGTHPPVNRGRTRRAERFGIALRHAFVLDFGADENGLRTGSADVMRAHGRNLIDSTTLSCRIDGATTASDAQCSRVELYLANAFAPAYRPEPGSAALVRLSDNASCEDIRALSF